MPEMSAFEAVLTVLDETAKPISAIMARLGALDAVAQKTESSLQFSEGLRGAGLLKEQSGAVRKTGEAAEEAGGKLDRMGKSLSRLGEAGAALGGTFTDLLPMFAGFAAIGSGAGLLELVHNTAEVSENLDVMSAKIGISAQQLQKWDFIANQSGIGSDTMNTGLERLNKNLGMAATGHDKNLVADLDHLKISLRDNKGHLKDAADLLPELATAFKNTHDPILRAALANTLFGRSGMDMLPLLDGGPEKINELSDAYKKYAYQLTPLDHQNLGAFTESWKHLKEAAGGLENDLGAKLAPLFTPVVEGMANWTAANKGWIATDIAHGVGNLSVTLKEQSGEIAHAFDLIAGTWKEQFKEIESAYDSFANWKPTQEIASSVKEQGKELGGLFDHLYKLATQTGPDNAQTNPGYAGNHPIKPKHANELLRAGDARAGIDYDRLDGGAVPAQAAPAGTLDVNVHFLNPPAGTTATVTAAPGGLRVRPRLGDSRMGGRG